MWWKIFVGLSVFFDVMVVIVFVAIIQEYASDFDNLERKFKESLKIWGRF